MIPNTSRIDSTHFITPGFDLRLNVVTNFAGPLQALLVCPGKRRRIRETPMQSVRNTRKDRTPCSLRFVANCNDVREELTALENVKHRLRLIVRNIDSYLVHHLNSEGIEFPRFKTGAVCFEIVTANVV